MNAERRASNAESFRGEHGRFNFDGFTFLRSLLTAAEVANLRSALASLAGTERAGLRGLLQHSPEIAALARSQRILKKLAELADGVPFPVCGILFDKSSRANWQVSWHQDLAVALKERNDVPGFGPWSVKGGVPHAYAPASVLERMLTLRIHLDDTDGTNGALRVIPGSHREGKRDEATIQHLISAIAPVTCNARASDALVMRPLLLHASSSALVPSHRRVIHIEYATDELPSPLQWFERDTDLCPTTA